MDYARGTAAFHRWPTLECKSQDFLQQPKVLIRRGLESAWATAWAIGERCASGTGTSLFDPKVFWHFWYTRLLRSKSRRKERSPSRVASRPRKGSRVWTAKWNSSAHRLHWFQPAVSAPVIVARIDELYRLLHELQNRDIGRSADL